VKRLSSVKRRLRNIRLLAFDVDGVLTDGGLWVGPGGEEWKRFQTRDGLGIAAITHRTDLKVAWVSGRRSKAVAARGKDLRIHFDGQGIGDKATTLQKIRAKFKVEPEHVLFVGDDLVDLPAFEESGVRVAVADAQPQVIAAADAVTFARGGHGAAREVAEAVLLAQGLEAALPGLAPTKGRRRRA
jgi:YrbI family 3-deoxy-D-manno-octulosonate 8-phosphate phosphatase